MVANFVARFNHIEDIISQYFKLMTLGIICYPAQSPIGEDSGLEAFNQPLHIYQVSVAGAHNSSRGVRNII